MHYVHAISRLIGIWRISLELCFTIALTGPRKSCWVRLLPGPCTIWASMGECSGYVKLNSDWSWITIGGESHWWHTFSLEVDHSAVEFCRRGIYVKTSYLDFKLIDYNEWAVENIKTVSWRETFLKQQQQQTWVEITSQRGVCWSATRHIQALRTTYCHNDYDDLMIYRNFVA